jgi:hypothetical protein
MTLRCGSQRRWLLALYACAVLLATWQRGGANPTHTTFSIFRQSFSHLVQHQDLYTAYPLEQGAAAEDRFKYSPSAAVMFAPLSVVPFALALLAWNLVNAGLLTLAITRILPPKRANLALLLLAPELFCSVQSSSSNALVTALILLAAVAYDEGRALRGAVLIITGVAIKLFPAAGVVLVILKPGRRRAAMAIVAAAITVFILPLLVISPHELLEQYRAWMALEMSDARDVRFGLSLMHQLRFVGALTWPNWTVQALGTVVFVLPLALRRDRWASREFRFHYLCSMLIYVVLFNHQAERQSFVIAATGAVLWFAKGRRTVERAVMLSLALAGIPTWPYLALWLAIHIELLSGAQRECGTVRSLAAPRLERRAGSSAESLAYRRVS